MRQTQTVPMTEQARIIRDTITAERKRRAAKRAETVVRWLFTAIGVFASGWLFMLAVGIVRADWASGFPTVDYGTATLLMVLLYSAWGLQSLGRAVAKSSRTTER